MRLATKQWRDLNALYYGYLTGAENLLSIYRNTSATTEPRKLKISKSTKPARELYASVIYGYFGEKSILRFKF